MSIRSLAVRCWQVYRALEKQEVPWLVRPGGPILFFGDLVRYHASPLKVISVGLNPSKREFPPEDPFVRFPRMRSAQEEVLVQGSVDNYLLALSEYFEIAPYNRWFRPAFESLLQGMGASFYPDYENAALHTDICSPLPTDPTWSRLKSERAILEKDGVQLWIDLVAQLDPDIVLVSVARHHLRKINFEQVGPWRNMYEVAREHPYVVESSWFKMDRTGKRTFFIFGRASQSPFGSVGGTDKREIGARIREAFHAGQ